MPQKSLPVPPQGQNPLPVPPQEEQQQEDQNPPEEWVEQEMQVPQWTLEALNLLEQMGTPEQLLHAGPATPQTLAVISLLGDLLDI
jgi:hypothetical protein